MAACLFAVGQAGQHNEVKTCAAITIPYGIYVSEAIYNSRLQLGFTLDLSMLSDNNADMAIYLACQGAGIPCISVTEEFRRYAAHEDLFYHYDGHFNTRGHAVYADLITPKVAELIKNRNYRVKPTVKD